MKQRPRPLVMGVLNATPDSFSDTGREATPPDAAALIARGLRLIEEGADIIDIGGESTRPGAQPVSARDELKRVLPVLIGLRGRVRLSIDTTKPEVAAAAADAGATILNDVSGLRQDQMAVLSARFETTVVMHMRGDPRTMARLTAYDDLLHEVRSTLRAAADRARSPAVWIDPGVGFAKDTRQNLWLLHHIDELCALGLPVLVGLSRKRFIGDVLQLADPADRISGSLGAAAAAYHRGAHIFRVHDVRQSRHLLDMLWAIDTAQADNRAGSGPASG